MASPLDAALHLARRPDGRWQLRSTRAEWATTMLRGRAAEDAAALLPGLYTLCGGAHRLAARHALAAARGAALAGNEGVLGPGAAGRADAQALRLDTLREHVRRLWLDAPRMLAGGDGGANPGPTAAQLTGAPFMCSSADLGDEATEHATRRWVQRHVLQADADAWVAAWEDDPAAQARRWAAAAATWPARWLGAVRGLLQERATACRALRAAATDAGLQPLAEALRTQPGFALAPTEGGQPAETGCWTRLADPLRAAGPPMPELPAAPAPPAPPLALWLRHAARIAEVARLAASGGGAWLAQGRFTPAAAPAAPDGAAPTAGPAGSASAAARPQVREGLGWCEMARGLLVHWVRLDADERIVAYRVLAPTEWNFHPEGAAAGALAGCLASAATADGVDMAQFLATAAAYDPCVELRLESAMPERADA